MSHNHKCMSCGESWECPIPSGCLAQADVLPSIVLKGPRGPQVFDHVCQRKTTPPEGVLIPLDVAEHLYGVSLDVGDKCHICTKFREIVTPRPSTESPLARITQEKP